MSKLNLLFSIPHQYDKGQWTDIVSAICNQVNNNGEGKMVGRYYNNSITPSATVAAAMGDMVWNNNVTVLGSAGSKYIILGWICTAGGSPGTWVDMRVLTGG